jgi:hypothetical protein
MAQLTDASDLVPIEVTDQDIYPGISYGIISRAWTYDRMGAQTRGDFGKAIFRIAVGKAVQAALERYVSGLGIAFKRDTTDYRKPDYWDIETSTGKSVDIKAFQVFSDYKVAGRPSLDPSRIVSSTLGESWSSFYPMLIPRDQFERRGKDYYIFAILSAPMSKRCPYTHDAPRGLIALPHSTDSATNKRFQFVHFASFAEHRIRSGKSFDIHVTCTTPFPDVLRFTLGYADAIGTARNQQILLKFGENSTISQVTALHYLQWSRRQCPSSVEPLLDITFNGVDDLGALRWEVYNTSFEDVWIYPNALWCLGWISKDAFAEARQKYPTYKPAGAINSRVGDANGILYDGSFCYFYPPVLRGGTKNENYYVLPQDLNTMDTLPTHMLKHKG